MKKRWVAAILGLGLVGAAAALVPVVNGQRAETAYMDGVARLDEALAERFGAAASAEVLSYDRRAFGAEARTGIDLPGSQFDMVVIQQVDHGMLGVEFDGALDPGAPIVAVLESLGGDARSLRFAGALTLLESRVQIDLDDLAGSPPGWGAAFAVEGLRFTAEGEWINGSAGGGLWLGDTTLVWDQLMVRPDGGAEVALSEVAVVNESEARDDGTLDARLRLDGRLVPPGDGPSLEAALHFEAGPLAIEPLLALGALETTPTDDPMNSMAYREAMAALAAAAPRFELTRLSLAPAQGEGLAGAASLAVGESLAARLRAGSPPLTLLSTVAFEARFTLAEDLPPQLSPALQRRVEQLQAFGILKAEDGRLALEAALTDGVLSIHGTPWWGQPDPES